MERMAGCSSVLLALAFLSFATGDQIKLSFHPKPQEGTSLIWFNRSYYQDWSVQLDNFLEVYRTPSLTEGRKENLVECSYKRPPGENSVCDIHTEAMSPCVSTEYFGFKKGKPCVFIEFQKLLHWKPKFYNSTKALPKNMPDQLKKKIADLHGVKSQLETIWLLCDGETPADRESIGTVHYFPYQGFPGYMFPYTGQNGYLNPITAVYFENPTLGLIINVECKAWAPGISHEYKHEIGLTRFQLLIDA